MYYILNWFPKGLHTSAQFCGTSTLPTSQKDTKVFTKHIVAVKDLHSIHLLSLDRRKCRLGQTQDLSKPAANLQQQVKADGQGGEMMTMAWSLTFLLTVPQLPTMHSPGAAGTGCTLLSITSTGHPTMGWVSTPSQGNIQLSGRLA